MKYVMGIDIGSTNIKAVVFDENGAIVAKGLSPTPYRNTDAAHPEWIGYDPDEIWRAAAQAIRAALSGAAVRVESVAVTGIGMDAAPIGAAGQTLYPFISWRCFRTEPQYQRLIAQYGKLELYQISGKQPLQYDTVHRIRWIKDNHPEIYRNAYKWLLIEDFINWKLCGAVATDYSMANCTSLLDTARREWSPRLLEGAGLDREKLAEIKPAGTVLGAVSAAAARETALPQGTRVVLGGHDYACAALACGAIDDRKIVDSTGTFDCISIVSNQAITTGELLNAGISCECHVSPGLYNLQCSMPSGGILEWWKDNLAGREAEPVAEPIWQRLMDSLATAKDGIYFLPHLFGCESPVFDPYSRGAFVGIAPGAKKADFLLALMEGLSFQLHSIIDSMETATRGRFTEMITVGGATRNAYWMQNKADILGKRILVPQELDEATCLGAALLAAVGAGIYRDEREALSHTRQDYQIYQPDDARHQHYARKYQTFKMLYPALREINHRIVKANSN